MTSIDVVYGNIQTTTIKKYPAPITLTLYITLSGGVFAIIIAAIQVHEPHSWRLGWNITLLGPVFNVSLLHFSGELI